MLGFYDYTVILTYLSALSAGIGIIVCLSGSGHPYIGIMCLMISGLCDTFDGRVARRKKNRTEQEKAFGVQIDSLSDLIAFGVLPACIGVAIYRVENAAPVDFILTRIPLEIIVCVSAFFILTALIRLAYFNVTVEETQGEGVEEKYYYGLPVTSTALIFPTFIIIRHFICADISYIYYILLIMVGIMFITKFRLKKPTSAIVYGFVSVGALEFIIVLIFRLMRARYGL